MGEVMERDSTTLPHIEMMMWVVYDHPLDYPQKYVARLWNINGDHPAATNVIALADTLVEIRQMLPEGLSRLERFDGDDECIVEVWL
jgi:hypothetical protein